MNKIENALGKTIRITNTANYARLAEMYEPITGTDYMSFEMTSATFGSALGAKMNCSREDITYLFALSSLKNISGGDFTLQTVNNKISDPTRKINGTDIVYSNALDILGDEVETKYPKEERELVRQIVSGRATSPEAFAVSYGRLFTIIKDTLIKKNGFDSMKATEVIFSEINSISEQFKSQSPITLSPEIKNCLENSSYQLDTTPDDIASLEALAGEYETGSIGKKDLVGKLSVFHYTNEKKTGLARS